MLIFGSTSNKTDNVVPNSTHHHGTAIPPQELHHASGHPNTMGAGGNRVNTPQGGMVNGGGYGAAGTNIAPMTGMGHHAGGIGHHDGPMGIPPAPIATDPDIPSLEKSSVLLGRGWDRAPTASTVIRLAQLRETAIRQPFAASRDVFRSPIAESENHKWSSVPRKALALWTRKALGFIDWEGVGFIDQQSSASTVILSVYNDASYSNVIANTISFRAKRPFRIDNSARFWSWSALPPESSHSPFVYSLSQYDFLSRHESCLILHLYSRAVQPRLGDRYSHLGDQYPSHFGHQYSHFDAQHLWMTGIRLRLAHQHSSPHFARVSWRF
ncbi:hypothetical protein C8J56DRAFT_1048993 [Mycena floridula]|nr:hypothetical protein C8J56DRAFT_1048993 [Mycena floridula]